MNPATTPKVQYTYADGADNTVRLMALVYPNGRELHYDYGSSDEMNDAASRVASLIDDDGTTHLVDYSYLGMGGSAQSVNAPFGRGFVIADSPQPEVKWTMVDLTGTNDPDTGDIYSGFDRFGRVKDNRWYNYDALADVDRIQYGYNRAGNRIWRKNVVADALGKHFDEFYGNDAIQRLKDLQRGTLNGSHNGVTDETYAECWSLDQTGNWQKYLQDDDGSGWDLNQSRTANTVNEITDITASTGPTWVTPAYSKAGNMTTMPQPADPTASFTATYDAWNRLVKLVDGTTTHTIATYQYDGAKRRVIEQAYTTGSLDETRHCYFTEPSQWQIIEERLDSSTEAEKQFVWGLRYIDDILLRDRDTNNNGTLDERLYGLQDANWNVTCLIDSNGAAQERFAYSAYGQPVFLDADYAHLVAPTFHWKTLYAGYEWNVIGELFNVRSRYYNALTGNWVQRDPAGYEDAVNLYQYTMLSPADYSDPSGLSIPGFSLCVVACFLGLSSTGDLKHLYELYKNPDNPDIPRQTRRKFEKQAKKELNKKYKDKLKGMTKKQIEVFLKEEIKVLANKKLRNILTSKLGAKLGKKLAPNVVPGLGQLISGVLIAMDVGQGCRCAWLCARGVFT